MRKRIAGVILGGMAALYAVPAAAQPVPADRSEEGDWYVSDDTDNDTGERKVYAFQLRLKKDDPD